MGQDYTLKLGAVVLARNSGGVFVRDFPLAFGFSFCLFVEARGVCTAMSSVLFGPAAHREWAVVKLVGGASADRTRRSGAAIEQSR